MPVVSFHHLPLPSLRAYVALSFAVLCLYLSFNFDFSWRKWTNIYLLELNDVINFLILALRNPWKYFDISPFTFIIQDTFGLWIMINTVCCSIMVMGKLIQQLVFGELRVSEVQHFKDKLWNFVFYKFIFVFGVINVQYLEEALLWLSWFTVIGCLHLLAQLAKDRFEYLSFSITYSVKGNFPLLFLFGFLMMSSVVMLLLAVGAGMKLGLSLFAFLAAECVLLILFLMQTFSNYIVRPLLFKENRSLRAWDEKGAFTYFLDLFMDVSSLVIELLHHFHMLLGSNIFLSMASLVICVHIRYLVDEIRRTIRKHRNYLWVLHHMEQNYPVATKSELNSLSDNCAICWEKLNSARKLPCNHMFHDGCLLSWLQQDTSCPTCRLILRINNPSPSSNYNYHNDNNVNRGNHSFHFNGSRYISWLPNFSVEVVHTQFIRVNQVEPNQNSQLDVMAHQVQQLFQTYPLNVLIADLQITRSVEATVGNILDGRLINPREETVDQIPPSSSSSIYSWSEILDSDSSSSSAEMEHRTFSNSPCERETLLNKRKEMMLISARNKYLSKHEDERN